MDDIKDFDDNTKKLIKKAEAGKLLLRLRNERGLSLSQVVKKLNISAIYLSEMERGLKTPGDQLLRDMAKFYKIDEDTLYNLYGRVPMSIITELEKNEDLRSTMYEIVTDQTLTEEEKSELYNSIRLCYEKLLSLRKHAFSDLEDDI
jgi:transcriptional regulator with XRE-family HTH domain